MARSTSSNAVFDLENLVEFFQDSVLLWIGNQLELSYSVLYERTPYWKHRLRAIDNTVKSLVDFGRSYLIKDFLLAAETHFEKSNTRAFNMITPILIQKVKGKNKKQSKGWIFKYYIGFRVHKIKVKVKGEPDKVLAYIGEVGMLSPSGQVIHAKMDWNGKITVQESVPNSKV